MEETFGEKIRSLRNNKGIGLREFAQKIKKSPAYISRIERNLEPPPSEGVILEMANILNIDSIELFKVANVQKQRMPPGVYETYKKNETYMKRVPEFLRIAKEKKLTDNQWQKIIENLSKEK